MKNQEELTEYLRNCPIGKDNFITAKSWPLDVQLNLFRIHYVLDVEDRFSKVYYFELGHPKCYYITQLDSGTPTTWQRWDSAHTYRVLTDEEYRKCVEPHHDLVQNRIQEWRKRIEERKERELQALANPDAF